MVAELLVQACGIGVAVRCLGVGMASLEVFIGRDLMPGVFVDMSVGEAPLTGEGA